MIENKQAVRHEKSCELPVIFIPNTFITVFNKKQALSQKKEPA